MVSLAARRNGSVRRESAEEIPGHFSVQFRVRRMGGAMARARKRVRVLDRTGRAHFSRRQSAHEAVPVLGMGDRDDSRAVSRCDLPRRGVHATQGHASAGQARLHAVVYLFRVAQHEIRADRVLHRAVARAGPRLFPAQLLAEHAGHPDRISAGRRAARVHVAARACGNAVRQLRDLRSGLRALRQSTARGGQRGISRLGEISATRMGPRAARQPGRIHRPRECRAARQPSATIRPSAGVLPDRQ